MNLIYIKCCFYFILVVFITACQSGNIVHNLDEFNNAVTNAMPGDQILLSNGIWNNAELLFTAKGTNEKPIVLMAEEKGKVFLEGQSNLRISGEYLQVEGLVFRNGNTPTNEVISFKKEKGIYANNCRVTECVIDNFNTLERFESETWVALYGKNNRVDHCYFTDKRNLGVTLVVRLVDSLCQNNNHRIDHNFFGYRQNLGSNGGETMRIGTSHYSLTTSATVVEENYYEHCDGEHEIISNKSCGNQFKNNTFVECRGTLTYRHGNDNIAEGNFFFGNYKEHSGGIRIINKRNKAINNYFFGLKGYRFRGALVIMNGVPSSPINRYHQVVDGVFSNNTFINCDHVQLCAGSDEERSLTPLNSKIENNIFYHDSLNEIFTVYDDITGISFTKNYINKELVPIQKSGFESMDIILSKNENDIYIPENPELEFVGCNLAKPSATKSNSGVKWYKHENKELVFDNGKNIYVNPGLNTLYEAIKSSSSGDIIVLEDEGKYKVNKNIKINHPITIICKNKESKAVLIPEKSSLFLIENEGSLKLSGLTIDGSSSPDLVGNCIISTSKYLMNRNYKLLVKDCNITNLDINNSFNFLKIYKNTFADSIVIENNHFSNITGNILALNEESDELGRYNAEYIRIKNSTFNNIKGCVLDLLRGGTDESTFGPSLKMEKCEFENIGHGKRNDSNSCISLHGVQIAQLNHLLFKNSKPLKLEITNGGPVTEVKNCEFINSEGIIVNSKNYKKENIKYNL